MASLSGDFTFGKAVAAAAVVAVQVMTVMSISLRTHLKQCRVGEWRERMLHREDSNGADTYTCIEINVCQLGNRQACD